MMLLLVSMLLVVSWGSDYDSSESRRKTDISEPQSYRATRLMLVLLNNAARRGSMMMIRHAHARNSTSAAA